MANPMGDRADDELLRLTGITRRELDCYDDELLQAWRGASLDEETVWRIRRVHRLRRQLGLDYDALEIIVRLVDRIEQLEAQAGYQQITVRVIEE
jgi:hypothetical protein